MKKFLILAITICLVNYSQPASKYYDGPINPYKFGYSIEGNQHRHEEKDEKGQIMGEFGFITGDGVYHLTAYATDENGNYKILFMKNIKIGLPGEPGSQPAPQNINTERRIDTTTAVPTTKLTPILKTKPEFDYKFKQTIPSDITSCSGCVIPLREKEVPVTKKQKQQLLPASFISPDIESQKNVPPPENKSESRYGGRGPVVKTKPTFTATKLLPKINKSVPDKLDVRVKGNQIQQYSLDKTTIGLSSQQERTSKPTGFSAIDREVSPSEISKSPTTFSRPLQIDQYKQTDAIKPSGVSAGKVPNSNHGEGRQRTTNGILYKFNYTVGYHGHHEQGDHAGAKDGGYYFVARDGYKRTVEYNANEFGFQPHVKLEQAIIQDIPHEETEKEAGLKGYEFKWFNI